MMAPPSSNSCSPYAAPHIAAGNEERRSAAGTGADPPRQREQSGTGYAAPPGPSWGREIADNSGQPRCPTGNQTCSLSPVMGRDGAVGPYMACKCSRLGSALPCLAGRSLPGRGGPERRRRPRPDGTGATPKASAGSSATSGPRASGRQRTATVTRGLPSWLVNCLAGLSLQAVGTIDSLPYNPVDHATMRSPLPARAAVGRQQRAIWPRPGR
jgi:hypothetical protein